MTDVNVQKEKDRECVCAWKPASFGKYTFHLVEVFQEEWISVDDEWLMAPPHSWDGT